MTVERDIEAALRAPLSNEQRAILDQRVRAAIAERPPVQRRGVPLRRSLALAGLLVIALPGLLIGGVVLHDNWFEPISVRELRQEILIAKQLVPLPEGREWPAHLTLADGSGMYEAGAGREWVENNAVCIWLDEWLDARAEGDAAREAKAAATIATVPTWPSWTSPYWVDGGFVGHLQPLIDAVAGGEEQPIRAEMRTNCSWVAEGE